MGDKLVGVVLFLFSLVVFVYYSVWVLLTVRAGPRIRGTLICMTGVPLLTSPNLLLLLRRACAPCLLRARTHSPLRMTIT